MKQQEIRITINGLVYNATVGFRKRRVGYGILIETNAYSRTHALNQIKEFIDESKSK